MPAARIFLQLISDFIVYLGLFIRPRKAIAAENLFLRRQLALYQKRKVARGESIPRRALRWLCSQGYSAGAMRSLVILVFCGPQVQIHWWSTHLLGIFSSVMSEPPRASFMKHG